MTVDINVKHADDAFLEDIDEIMEDTMVQMFILQPRDKEALETAQEQSDEYSPVFYVAPLSLREHCDANCVGFFVDTPEALKPGLEKPLFVEESALKDNLQNLLIEGHHRGIILNATAPHEELEDFYLAIGPANLEAFDNEALAKLPMERIVLQSGYPDFGFEEIYGTAKRISDTMFRPEQSIIAAATKSSLTLLGFKKA